VSSSSLAYELLAFNPLVGMVFGGREASGCQQFTRRTKQIQDFNEVALGNTPISCWIRRIY